MHFDFKNRIFLRPYNNPLLNIFTNKMFWYTKSAFRELNNCSESRVSPIHTNSFYPVLHVKIFLCTKKQHGRDGEQDFPLFSRKLSNKDMKRQGFISKIVIIIRSRKNYERIIIRKRIKIKYKRQCVKPGNLGRK